MSSTALHPSHYLTRALKMGWRRAVPLGHLREFSKELYAAHCGAERLRATSGAAIAMGAPVACWRTEPTKYGTRHVIEISETYVTAMTKASAKESHRLSLEFGRQVIRHEVWHGRITRDAHRTFEALVDAIKVGGADPNVWNLLEDARIEAAARARDGKGFGWTRFFEITDTDQPTKYFWNLKTVEATYTARTAKWTGAAKTLHPDTGKNWDTRALIEDFWMRACACPTAQHTIALATEWQRVFGTAVAADIPYQSGVGHSTGRAGAAPGEIAPTNYTATYKKAEHKTTGNHQTDLSYYQSSVVGGRNADHTQQVRNIEQTFTRIQSARDGQRQRVGLSGNRLHISGVIAGEPNSFKRTTERGGKRRIVVLFDMSSSMRYQYRHHGLAFLEAVQNLRRRGLLDATLICSGGEKWAVIPANLPLTELRRIEPDHGCESITQTLDANREALTKADTVLVYTDGYLTDGDVDAGHWRSQGVDLIGVCADTNPAVRPAMEEHFGRVITAPDGHALAVSILDYITRHQ